MFNDCWLCPHVVTLHHPDPERTRHGPVQRVKPQPITWRDEPEMLIGNAVMGWPYPNPAFQKMLNLVELPLDWTGVVTGYIGIATSTIFVRKQARNIVSGTTSVLLVLGGLNSDPWTMGLRSPQKCWVWVKLGTCTPVLILVGWFQSRNGGRTYSNSYHTKICKVSGALELKESMAKRKTTRVLWVDPYLGDPVSHRFGPHRS